MARLNTGPYGLVLDWLSAHADSARQNALLVWIQAAAHDPIAVTSGEFTLPNGRKVLVAHVPGAETRVSFVVTGPPVPALTFIEFNDDRYEPRRR